MDKENRKASDLFGVLKSWLPWRSEPANISKDFWMPDHSCRVCYECDSEFTIFNRRHHCRLCGRIFCAKCTANSIPAPCDDPNNIREEWEKIRVCNFCFKQWELGITTNVENGAGDLELNPSSSSSADSFVSSLSSGAGFCNTANLGSMSFQLGHCDEMSENSSPSPYQSAVTNLCGDFWGVDDSGKFISSGVHMEVQSTNRFELDTHRSEYEDDNFSAYQFNSNGRNSWSNEYYNATEIQAFQDGCASHTVQTDGQNLNMKSFSCSTAQNGYLSCQDTFHVQEAVEKGDGHDVGDECEAPSSLCAAEDVESEPVDFDNNGLLWLPPEPENEEDEREDILFDDDDDGDVVGEWGCLQTSGQFESGDFGTVEEQRKIMKSVVDGHFRALVSQLLLVENVPMGENDAGESWLDIITTLSWEAATALKPDTSRGGGMDPGGYVKVKCIAAGHRSESKIIKGIVCKKNVAHRRMTTRIEKPRVMILGGALEYQRVSNLLSSVDTLLKQETDHLKMTVVKIGAHNPDVLLVEKSVSRYAQDYLLEKNISLVLNIKRPLLERIARCTGAQIVPSVDHLSSQKIGYCDSFHVEKYLETHGSAGQDGKKLTKTLMYFEDCPKPFGCTVLLRGANGDELKRVKHVIQYGVFAAYHLALETCFLADEGASLPEFPLKEPINVALPNNSLGIRQAISKVPGLGIPASDNLHASAENCLTHGAPTSTSTFPSGSMSSQNTEFTEALSLPAGCLFQDVRCTTGSLNCFEGNIISDDHPPSNSFVNPMNTNEYFEDALGKASKFVGHHIADDYSPSEAGGDEHISMKASVVDELVASSASPPQQEDIKPSHDEFTTSKDFPPSSSDHQSILVSLSSRCIWKGTVCERSHLFRIKYYGSFDKPLGRFLQDHLFDLGYRCRSCEMPSEAHVQCYTHRQGTLTISVKKLPEILLPGEREGKIWMWHRCLRCPRTNGFPPATRRIVMSDAAWGLSFGKFLELSFSNHAAASRVASCGHSLHRDCLRFYGSGKMVACFRYASIDVHSVFLPPAKVDFNYESQDWVKKEADEVVDRAEVLFSEVLNSLTQIAAKKSGGGSVRVGSKIPESRLHIAELEHVLHEEKSEFEETLRKCFNRDVRKGQPVGDILEINRLRRQLLFQSYMWDHRLVYASSLDENYSQSCMQISLETEGKMPGTTNVITSRITLMPTKATLNSGDPLPLLCSGLLSGSPPQPEQQAGNTSSYEQLYVERQKREGSLDCNYALANKGSISDHEKISEQVNPVESGAPVRRALSDSQFSFMTDLSDTLDAAWTGESQSGGGILKENSLPISGSVSADSSLAAVAVKCGLDNQVDDRRGVTLKVSPTLSPELSMNLKGPDNTEESLSWLGMPFFNFYRSLNKNFIGSTQKLDTVGGYNPVYVSTFRELELRSGARLLLPVGNNETVIPVYDDEPTSIIAYALASQDYHMQLADEGYRSKDMIESSVSLPLPDVSTLQSFYSIDESIHKSISSIDDSILSMSGSHSSFVSDPLLYSKSLHVRVNFSDNGPHDKVKYTVTFYYGKHFEALRKICCPSELDFVRSVSRCKKWGAQGGKSNVFFAKTLDDRFIIKQVTKTELESFIKFAPEYFKYLTEAISTKSPTSLAKILGIYQVVTKHVKGGKESKIDVLVMENLLFGRKVTRLYDLKGSSRSRYNPDASGSNKVLLDQNLIEAMPTSPIFVGNKAKRLLERAVWNDTAFLASVDVMDYSLLVGVDEENHELVLGIIDFMRQYTWDKHLETWVKASGILGGPKNASPTVISPKQYKKRFRKAMTTYFLMVPDQWSPIEITPSKSNKQLSEENSEGENLAEPKVKETENI